MCIDSSSRSVAVDVSFLPPGQTDRIAAGYIQLLPLLFAKLGKPAKLPKRSDLTHLQYHILEELYHQRDGIAMTPLAMRIQISKQQLTPLIAKLEALQLVVKVPDPDDKRSFRLRLTEQGEQPVH
ncbi:MarR family transcriptional regulator [Cohnella nanjingensis]|uniref:MarR family transcriptional regulator n=1 Tax=Cohnella nanjingensis TaxID=1387779 RepID=UPI001FE339FE|nr:MarR family transcriptional regulator [Cohnella nanjingensis]